MPNVSLSTSGGTTNLSGTVTVTVLANPSPQVQNVKFYVDSVLKYTDSAGPYTYSWDTTTVGDGTHELMAVALFQKTQTQTTKLSVTVANIAAPPPPPPPTQDPPVNTALPTISGTATEGQTLTVALGTWTNSPTSFTKQWMRCDAAGANGAAIPGATGSGYALVAADVGATIRCVVVAYNSVGPSAAVQTVQTAVVSALVAAVPVEVAIPTVSGQPVRNNSLTSSTGAWTNSPTGYTYKWMRCDSTGENCAYITGATSSSYVLVTGDVTKRIRSAVIAANGAGSSAEAYSLATGVVADVIVPPPPSGTFGALLPPRLPESPGGVYDVESLGALQNALNSVPNGSTIRITQSINMGGASWVNFGRIASATAPITITSSPGVVISGVGNDGWQTWTSAYMRFRGLEFANCTSTLKITGYPNQWTCHDIEIDGCYFHNNTKQGLFIGSEQLPHVYNVQVWNCKFFHNGSDVNYDHNLYWDASAGTQNVLANCLFEDPYAYNFQLYPQAKGIIVTCCTVNGYQSQPDQRGSIAVGTSDYHISQGTATTRITIVGTIASNGYYPGFHAQGPDSSFRSPLAPNNTYDSIAYNNSLGSYDGPTTTYTHMSTSNPLYVNPGSRDFRLQAGSPAINYIAAARYGYVPPKDIKGNTRVTADAGCYAAGATVA